MIARATLRTLSVGLACLLALSLGACGKSKGRKAEAKEDDSSDEGEEQVEELPELSTSEQSRVSALKPDAGLLPTKLAGALIGAPREWAREICSKVYPKVEVVEDNPLVNILLEVGGADAPIHQLDVRWDPVDRERIGSVVLIYGTIEIESLRTELASSAKAEEEGKERFWLASDQGLRISFYPKAYEGGTRVSFERINPTGGPLRHADDEMKHVEEWKGASRGTRSKARGRRKRRRGGAW